MAENSILSLKADQEETADDKNEASPSASPIDDAERQMRRALGLHGRTLKVRPEQERRDTPPHTHDRSGGFYRRRFVRDGDVPVTVIRRDPSTVPTGGSLSGGPSSAQVERVEAALAAEVAARERAERALTEAQAQAQDLQTRLGHAELARTEAAEMVRRQQEALAHLRIAEEESARGHQAAAERVAEAERKKLALQRALDEERAARVAVEAALDVAKQAQKAAESRVKVLSDRAPTSFAVGRSDKRSAPSASRSATRKWKTKATTQRDPAPQPVKWWLTPPKAAKRQRTAPK